MPRPSSRPGRRTPAPSRCRRSCRSRARPEGRPGGRPRPRFYDRHYTRKEPSMPFELPPLPYDFGALEPHIDARTMEIHHDKHHQAYVDNANKALDGTEWADRPVEAVLANIEILPEDIRTAVRNNAGGHANHSLFWTIMGPGGGGDPEGDLAAAIADAFGGADELRSAVNDAGVKRFGSGWSWLVWDGTGLSVR